MYALGGARRRGRWQHLIRLGRPRSRREDHRNRRGGRAPGAKLYPLRPFRTPSPRARTMPRCAGAGRLRHRPFLSLPAAMRAATPTRRCCARSRVRTAGHGGALAGRRVLPRGDEYRQYVDPGPDHRLRPVRLPGRLRRQPYLPTIPTSRAATPASQQPQVAFWNPHCLAQALLPLWRDTDAADATEATHATDIEAAKEAAVAAACARRSTRSATATPPPSSATIGPSWACARWADRKTRMRRC